MWGGGERDTTAVTKDKDKAVQLQCQQEHSKRYRYTSELERKRSKLGQKYGTEFPILHISHAGDCAYKYRYI